MTPQLLLSGHKPDTLFAFTVPQARQLAMYLSSGRYCDSILQVTETKALHLHQLVSIQDSLLRITRAQVALNQQLQQGEKAMRENLERVLLEKEKQYRHERTRYRLACGAIFFMGSVMLVAAH